MHLIDEDHITQAVIASHAGAEDARLRDVMTSLVQHLHAFAREVKLSESEWQAGMRFLAEAGSAAHTGPGAGQAHGVGAGADQELATLSDALGLTMLVKALNQPPCAAGNGARAPQVANFTPALRAQGSGPVATLMRALKRSA